MQTHDIKIMIIHFINELMVQYSDTSNVSPALYTSNIIFMSCSSVCTWRRDTNAIRCTVTCASMQPRGGGAKGKTKTKTRAVTHLEISVHHAHLVAVKHRLQDLLDAMTACKHQGACVSWSSATFSRAQAQAGNEILQLHVNKLVLCITHT